MNLYNWINLNNCDTDLSHHLTQKFVVVFSYLFLESSVGLRSVSEIRVRNPSPSPNPEKNPFSNPVKKNSNPSPIRKPGEKKTHVPRHWCLKRKSNWKNRYIEILPKDSKNDHKCTQTL